MKSIIRHISFLLAILIVSQSASCTRDDAAETRGNHYTGERIPMNIRFRTGDAAADDSTVTTVRVLVFNEKGALVYNDVSEAKSVSGFYTAEAEAARGYNNFYIVCNENQQIGQKLAAVTVERAIEEISFEAAGLVPPIPMYGKVARAFVDAKSDGSDATVSIDGITTSHLPVKVNRMLARISFTAVKNIATPEEDFMVEKLSIRVCRMPLTTTIAENRPYTGDKWTSNITSTGTGQLDNNGNYVVTNGNYTIPDGLDRVTFPDLYIPEHLLTVKADRSQATYLSIDAACRMKNGSTQLLHSTYQVCIGQNPPSNFDLKRNNHYNIHATITGIGSMGIYAEIQAMDQYDIPINWKPVDGLVIVSDKISDYDFGVDTCKNINVWNDYTVYSGILKTYHSDKGYNDISFKYGSLIAVRNDAKASAEQPFIAPASSSNLGDILWYPSSFGNPYGKASTWNDIPYITSGNIPIDNSRVHEALGDPCKLVGLSAEQILDERIVDNRQWHMATPSEYAILMQAADNETNAYGYKAFHYILAPNVKTRGTDGILAASKDGRGQYWTTTLSSAFGFKSVAMAGGSVAFQDPRQGFAVRCVRNVIPPTELSVSGSPSISYQGNLTTGSSFSVGTNIPYWTATLIENPSDPEIGDSRDFSDFSFAPGGTNVKSVSGSFNQIVHVYLPRRESRSTRTFRIRVTGMGFDGVTETMHVTASQSGYYLHGEPSFFPVIDDEHWIPAAGGSYQLTIDITPKDIAVPAGYLIVAASYHGVEISRTIAVSTTPDNYLYTGITMNIPENQTPDPIGIEFSVHLTATPNPGILYANGGIGRAYRLQDKK